MKSILNVNKNKYVNGVCIDWFEFTLFNTSYYEVLDFLGLVEHDADFNVGHGQQRYKCCLFFENIYVLFNNPKGDDDMGIHVRMTGQGCRSFDERSKVGFDNLIKSLYYLMNFEKTLNDKPKAKMSRIDVAYDDFEGLIDLDQCIKDTRDGNVVTRFRRGSIIESFDFNNPSITYKTLNCGRQGSNIWITIYDKLAERKSKDIVPDCNYWVRCEIKMRHTNADRFIQLLSEGKPMIELYFLVLNNYIRFVVPSDTDSNKWRWTVAHHWQRFCNSVIDSGKISLYVPPSDHYDQNKLISFVIKQAGAAIYTYTQKFGIFDLLEQVEDKKYHLAFKYRELLSDPEPDEEVVNYE